MDEKPDFETSFAWTGFKLDFTSMTVADDAIADDQPKAGAGADGFRRGKRFEQMRLDFGRNPRTVVYDFNDELIVFQASANAGFSDAVDRVNGVVDEIGPDLIEFAAVSHDARHGAIERANERHVFQFVADGLSDFM